MDPDPDPLVRGTDPQLWFSHTAIVKPTVRTDKTRIRAAAKIVVEVWYRDSDIYIIIIF